MPAGRSVIASALVLATLVIPTVRGGGTRETPPDLQMLLNLDLFTPGAQEKKPAKGAEPADSMLDQIRSLDAMGYLNPRGGQSPVPAYPAAASGQAPAPQSGSQIEARP
jgi:hypothetical protein